MTHLNQPNSFDEVLELLTEHGADSLAEAIRILLNAAMLIERQHFLNAAPYERSADRKDYANGRIDSLKILLSQAV